MVKLCNFEIFLSLEKSNCERIIINGQCYQFAEPCAYFLNLNKPWTSFFSLDFSTVWRRTKASVSRRTTSSTTACGSRSPWSRRNRNLHLHFLVFYVMRAKNGFWYTQLSPDYYFFSTNFTLSVKLFKTLRNIINGISSEQRGIERESTEKENQPPVETSGPGERCPVDLNLSILIGFGRYDWTLSLLFGGLHSVSSYFKSDWITVTPFVYWLV